MFEGFVGGGWGPVLVSLGLICRNTLGQRDIRHSVAPFA